MTEPSLHARLVIERENGFTLDIGLDVPAGSTVALLGPNGAGKSTAVDALSGILPIDDGRIVLGDRVLDDPASRVFLPSEQRRVGVVFQRYLLFEHLSVAQNIGFGPSATGASKAEAGEAARQWMSRLGLANFAERRPSELSGGQAQRVALARALAAKPDLLLLDEPLAALDIETRTQLRRSLSDHLADFAGPRVLITHDPADAFLLADTVCILEEGRVTQTGSPEEIRRRPATSYVAALAGLNLLSGSNDGGTLTLDDHTQTLSSANTQASGPVLITIRPNAIALHAEQPHGSPRNSWQTTIAAIEPLGDITRVTLASPLPLSADITPGAARSMSLQPGSAVWASIKATEVHVDAIAED